jgi:IS5 family transposase
MQSRFSTPSKSARSPIRTSGGGSAASRWTGSPHPTTSIKLATRCGTAAIDGLNEAWLAKAVQAKVQRTTRLRAATTVVPATWPTRPVPGLLAKAVTRKSGHRRRIEAAGDAVRTELWDWSRSGGKRAYGIAAKLRMRSAQGRDEAQAVVKRITG